MEVKQQSSPLGRCHSGPPELFAILALILDAGTAVSAAGRGLQLCLETVVPSLFPFLVAARLFTGSGAAQWCARVLGPVMGPAFGLPSNGAAAVVLGLLGGYPVGAQTAASLYGSGQLTRKEAEQLLAFVATQAPPSFSGWLAGFLEAEKSPQFYLPFTSFPLC